MKWLARIGLGLLVLLAVLALGLWWLLGTGAGLRFALARASGFTGGALSVQRADGDLAGPMHLQGLRYAGADGLDVRIADLRLDVALWALAGKRLHLQQLDARNVQVTLPKAGADTGGNPGPLQPPLAIQVDGAHVAGLRIVQDGAPLLRADRLDLAGRWDDAGLALKTLQLRGPDGHVELAGQVALGAGYRGNGRATFAWRLGGRRYAGRLDARNDGRTAHVQLALSAPTAARLTLDLDPDSRRWTGAVRVPAFDPADVLGSASLDTLALALDGQGRGLGGRITGDVQMDRYHLELAPLQAQLSDDHATLQVQALTLRSPQVPGTLQAHGTLRLDAQPLAGSLQLAWQGVELPEALAVQRLDSHGTLSAQGDLKQFQARGAVAIGPPGQLAQLRLDLAGTPQRLTLRTLDLEQPHGTLAAHGTVDLQPVFGWQLEATAHGFDPGELVAGWPGALDAHLSTRGTLPSGNPDALLVLNRLGGRLRGRPLRGHGRLHLAPSQVLDGTLQLTSGRSTVTLTGQPGARNDVQLALDLRALDDWLPRAAGRLAGHVHVTGLAPALAVDARLQGSGLAYAGYRVRTTRLDAHVPDISHPGGTVRVAAADLYAAGLALDTLGLQAGGSEADHHLTLHATGPQVSGDLALQGSLAQGRWQGTLGTLRLRPRGLPAWHLQAPADLHYGDGAFGLSELCLTAGEPLLCARAEQSKAGVLDADYRLRALPLALLLDAAGYGELPLRVDGALEGQGTLHRSAQGVLGGQATIASPQGAVTYLEQPDRPLLRWHALQVQARATPGRTTLDAHARLDDNGVLDAQVVASGPDNALDGHLDARLDSLAALELASPELANVQGRLDARFGLAGTLAQQAVTGRARIEGLAAELPRLGLRLGDGQITLVANDPHSVQIDGRIRSGKGTAYIIGTYGLGDTPSALAVTGEAVTAADIPMARVTASPAVVLRNEGEGWSVVGKVDVDRADVNLDRLPGGGALQGSPDVVVVDAGQPSATEAAQASTLSARVAFDLGQHTHVSGKGLDGKVTGTVTVIEQPGKPTLAQGQLLVDGTYKAYGQDLVIEQGRVLFAHSPIDDPGLDVRAVRKLNPNATIDEGQEVGLHITGTAQRPVLDVFSNPTMDQSDALAYLVTGKPLSQVGSGEGNVVNSAAQTLGSAAGNLLAKSVGSKLGFDEVGVSSNQALGGGSAFTVGKYLSPRLYLSYGVGLFQPGQVITLRYRLSQRWSFEAQNAPDFSRASLNYRIER